MCKNNNMNYCKVSGKRYYKAAEHNGLNGGPHTPKYDFTLSENVMDCVIP